MPNIAFSPASFLKSFVLLSLVTLSVGVSPAHAQVFDSGPSDPALFDMVIDLPPSPDIDVLDNVGGDGLSTQLNVAADGTVGAFFIALEGSEVNISGGTVGCGFDARFGSEVNISGGIVGNGFDALDGSVVNISGGSVGGGFFALDRSVVNISGGNLGDDFNASFGSEVNISGGTVGDGFSARDSVINIRGGNVGRFSAFSDSEVNLFGSDFLLDGVLLENSLLGQPFTITDRDVTLSGLLTDGSAFSFDLNSSFLNGEDLFVNGATLTVTLVTPFVLGDVNQDGLVDFLDIGPFIALLSNGEFQDEADIDRSGVVDFLDIGPFIAILSDNQAPIVTVAGDSFASNFPVRHPEVSGDWPLILENSGLSIQALAKPGFRVGFDLLPEWSTFLQTQNPDVIIISGGVNDLLHRSVRFSPGRQVHNPDYDQYYLPSVNSSMTSWNVLRIHFEEMIAQAKIQHPGVPIYLFDVAPILTFLEDRGDTDIPYKMSNWNSINDWIKTYTDSDPDVTRFPLNDLLVGDYFIETGGVESPRLHPDASTQQIIADALIDLINSCQ